MKEIVRVVRIMEYVGERAWVENTLATGAVPRNGEKILQNGAYIKSATIGSFAEVIANATNAKDEEDALR